jgi:hypothetical protein
MRKPSVAIGIVSVVLAALTGVFSGALKEFITEQDWSPGAVVGVASLLIVLAVALLWWLRQDRRGEPDPETVEALDLKIREATLDSSVKQFPDLIGFQGRLDVTVQPRHRFVHDPTRPVVDLDRGGGAVGAVVQAQGRLLIVGEPGSGKTIALYTIIQRQFQGGDDPLRWSEMLDDRVPLLVNLSAWSGQESFEDFLVDYLSDPARGYGIPDRATIVAWLGKRRFWLALDGLDEVHPQWRKRCLGELNAWLPVDMSVVLTCRTHEYEELIADGDVGVKLFLAVELRPLSSRQLSEAFDGLTRGGSPEWGYLNTDQDHADVGMVREVLANPLLLNLAVSGIDDPETLRFCADADEVRITIFDGYLKRALGHDDALRGWLEWIARYLVQFGEEQPSLRATGSDGSTATVDQTVFDWTRLTPGVVPRYWSVPLLGLTGGLAGVLVGWLVFGQVIGLVIGPAFGLTVGLVFGLVYRNARPARLVPQIPPPQDWVAGLATGLAVGLVFGLAVALFFRLVIELFGGTGSQLFDGETALAIGVAAGLSRMVALAINPRPLWVQDQLSSPYSRSRNAALAAGIATGLIFAVTTGLLWGLSFGPIVGLAGGLVTGLAIGLALGLNNGGWFIVSQRVTWQRLHAQAGLEPNPIDILTRGLDTKHTGQSTPVLRPVGSGVRFLHNDVRDHVAITGNHLGSAPLRPEDDPGNAPRSETEHLGNPPDVGTQAGSESDGPSITG